MTSPTPRSRYPACALCGGTFVGGMRMTSQHKTGVFPFRKRLWVNPLSTLSAVVCLGCGHTKLFADELNRLRFEAQRHPEIFDW
ncbi:hypothetical protein [Saccharopolyspora endophytica]|uniref:YgiT-type zinc finger protein n=1 Tax=Saccharopolyspora endophytica TaxID=543886 RepID=A0ABS5DJU4_9PSEU|nr:hypothetical protein [Saccharopolyspora endophytica]MBQ0926558.1 hypothetical protein [Saccharopolyspora endophytica]